MGSKCRDTWKFQKFGRKLQAALIFLAACGHIDTEICCLQFFTRQDFLLFFLQFFLPGNFFNIFLWIFYVGVVRRNWGIKSHSLPKIVQGFHERASISALWYSRDFPQLFVETRWASAPSTNPTGPPGLLRPVLSRSCECFL